MKKEKPFDFIAKHDYYLKTIESNDITTYIFLNLTETFADYFEIFVPKSSEDSVTWEYNRYFIEQKWNTDIVFYHFPNWAVKLVDASELAFYERDKIRRLFKKHG